MRQSAERPPRGAASRVKFYLTAILFILFDVEVVFLYPWAVLFRRLGMFGFVEMMIFVLMLVLGLLYVWRKGRARVGLTPVGRARRSASAPCSAPRSPLRTIDRRGEAVVVGAPKSRRSCFGPCATTPSCAFDFLADLTAVDYLGRTPRFEVVYHLLSLVANGIGCA